MDYDKSLETGFFLAVFRMVISALNLLLLVFYEIYELYKEGELSPNQTLSACLDGFLGFWT